MASSPGGASVALLLEAIAPVLVEDGGEFSFAGAITRREAQSVWTWLRRDLAPDLLGPQLSGEALETVVPELLSRARAAAAVKHGSDAERRLRVQLGGAEMLDRLPAVLDGIKCFPLLSKAEAFGRAISGMEDDEALGTALQSMPRHDASVSSLLMMAAMGQVAQPSRLVIAAIRSTADASEWGMARAGFGPLVDAILARAQDAIPPMLQVGAFADMDLICHAVERFHRLIKAINTHIELFRGGRWSTVMAGLTRTVSARLEPRLRELPQDINRALRVRDGTDRLDADSLLAALNGFYLLTTVRDCRDSLALNEVFDEIWNRSGPTLEQHLTHTMEARRISPGDRIVAERLDMGIKMAELRFGAEYAEILRNASSGVERRLSTSD